MTDEITEMLLQGRKDFEWYGKNIKWIKDKYNNRFIAFRKKKILASDTRLNSLLDKLNKKGLDTSDIIIEFVTKINRIL